MTVHAFLFEAASIQRYILAGGKLADMVAASEMVDRLCTQQLPQLLSTLDLSTKVEIPRNAGGTFYLIFDDENSEHNARRLQNVWSLFVPQYAPGLEFVHTLASDKDAYHAVKTGIDQLSQQRNYARPHLPESGPLIRLAPRTGGATVSNETGPDGEKEWTDQNLFRKRETMKDIKRLENEGLLQKFVADKNPDSAYRWPRDMEKDFPFVSPDKRDVAIVHADGNGLGQIIRILNNAVEKNSKAYVEFFKTFSGELEDVTKKAAQAATANILEPVASKNKMMPARPLVLGGDDLTMIIRADLALDFTECFIEAFERGSVEMMKKLVALLQKKNAVDAAKDLPEQLTACAGICYIKANQPFSMAYGLAESLCGMAKDRSRTQSSIVFHRVLSSLIEDAKTMVRQESTFSYKDKNEDEYKDYRLTLGAYGVGSKTSSLPRLSDLKELLQSIHDGELNYSALRNIATVLPAEYSQAEALYQRWRETMKAQQRNSELAKFDRCIQPLIGEHEVDKLPFNKKRQSPPQKDFFQSPLGDLLTLYTLTQPISADAESREN